MFTDQPPRPIELLEFDWNEPHLGDAATSAEVLDHPIVSTVITSNLAGTRHVPDDVVRQELDDAVSRTARIHLNLPLMQLFD
jgi:hypothetical protein